MTPLDPTPLDPTSLEQLCAWMDGELPPDEARFLERRLANDRELRAQWERWQLASSCLKGQPLRPMDGDLAERIQAAISGSSDSSGHAPRRTAWPWAIAASVAALAIAIGVQMRPTPNAVAPQPIAHVGESVTAPIAASPAAADLVALSTGSSAPATASAAFASDDTTSVASDAAPRPMAARHLRDDAATQSPMPLTAQSPTDFPLLASSEAKTWPRSPLASSGSDGSMEAYLVRHNELVSGDGLGGFVPYVDVVTRERGDGDSDDSGDAASDGDNSQ